MCRGTQNNSNTIKSMEGISCYFIFAYLNCTNNNKINIHFCQAQKHLNNRICYEWHSYLVNRASRSHSDVWVTISGNCWRFISYYFMQFLDNNFKEHYTLLKNLRPMYRAVQYRSKLFFSNRSFFLYVISWIE